MESWTTSAGIPTVGRIDAPGTIEGGDAVWLRPDLLCIGRTLRTNDAGARRLPGSSTIARASSICRTGAARQSSCT